MKHYLGCCCSLFSQHFLLPFHVYASNTHLFAGQVDILISQCRLKLLNDDDDNDDDGSKGEGKTKYK
jgi:hypothetical protein